MTAQARYVVEGTGRPCQTAGASVCAAASARCACCPASRSPRHLPSGAPPPRSQHRVLPQAPLHAAGLHPRAVPGVCTLQGGPCAARAGGGGQGTHEPAGRAAASARPLPSTHAALAGAGAALFSCHAARERLGGSCTLCRPRPAPHVRSAAACPCPALPAAQPRVAAAHCRKVGRGAQRAGDGGGLGQG